MTVVANRSIVAATSPVLEIWNGSGFNQQGLPARRDRRSLAAAWPLLRTLCDLGDLRAWKRSLTLRRPSVCSRVAALDQPHSISFGAEAHVQTDHAVRQDLERPSGARSQRRHLPALYRPPSRP